MADIELVVKIPEGLKKDFELEQWTALSCMEIKNALIDGTPLNEVLDKIKSEIEHGYCEVNNDYDHGRNYGLYMATQIIDKYRGEVEPRVSEDEE